MMKDKKRRRIYCIVFTFISLVACFIFQGSVHCWLQNKGARFVSPINEENSIIRLQNVHSLDAPVLFIGSSLTERLLPRKNVASVAMSHSSFVYVEEFMDTCYSYKPGTVYVLEVNNLFNGRNEELTARTKQWDFSYFRGNHCFSFSAKPVNLVTSAVFYLKEHNKHETDQSYDDGADALVDMTNVPDITPQQIQDWAHIIDGVQRLKNRGGRICFANHPCKVTPKFYADAFVNACILAKHLNIPVLNYNTSGWVQRFDFSDPTHLVTRNRKTVMYMNTVARAASEIAVD